MATLQKLRNMGPLLIIFVGLALFAFIAGDAWKILSPHQGTQDAGEVNGDALAASDFSSMINEYTDVIKFARGISSIGEEQNNQIQDEVWSSYVSNKILQDEAQKIGLSVTDAEVQAVISAGTNQLLLQTPFRNQQTGAFDKDLLANFLSQYSQYKDNPQFIEQYTPLYNYWIFIEKELRRNILSTKYQSLLLNAIVSNPVAAQAAFNDANKENELLVASFPYTSINDTTVTISDADYQKAYKKQKEAFKQMVETRDIKYIAFQLTPSQADRDEHVQKINEQANILAQDEITNVASFLSNNSSVNYSQVPWSKDAFPADIAARIDSIKINEVFVPYYNAADDSYNTFKVLAKEQRPDSVQFRQIVAQSTSIEASKILADSIMKALNEGADFEQIAKNYGQEATATWMSSKNFEGAKIINDDAQYINTLFTAKKGDRKLMTLGISKNNVIVEVLDTRNTTDKYLAWVIKTPAKFSNVTRNNIEGEFRQFIASCTNVGDMEKFAEENGYRVQTASIANSNHNVAGIEGTRDALRWVFDAKAGDVSTLYRGGDNYLLFVGVNKINEKGYRPVDDVKQLLASDLMKEKKAAQIIPQMNSDFTVLGNMNQVRIDTVKYVTFSAPANIHGYTEPAISAKASQMAQGEVSEPIQGNNGVYVIKVLNQNDRQGTFSVETEEETLKGRAQQGASRYLNELYMKANIVDNRYLFF